MLKNLAFVFGGIFIIMGILGFIPAAAPNNMFLGIFPVDAPFSAVSIIEDSISLLAGAIAVWCGMKGPSAARRYFQVLGSIFLVFTILGFIYGDQPVLGFMPNSKEDLWFNVVFALLFMWIGFGVKAKATNPKSVNTL